MGVTGRSHVFELKDKDELDRILMESKELIVLDASAIWCAPCKAFAPEVENVAAEYTDIVRFFRFDVDQCQDIANEYGIQVIPTCVFFKNGKKVAEVMGANAGSLESTIKKYQPQIGYD